jgi:hypothetical protein
MKLQPELRDILAALAKIVQDAVHYFHAARRVTVLDFPPDDSLAARKHPLRAWEATSSTPGPVWPKAAPSFRSRVRTSSSFAHITFDGLVIW